MGDYEAGRRAGLREAATILDVAASDIIGGRKRVPQIDQHTAYVLRSKADAIWSLRDKTQESTETGSEPPRSDATGRGSW